MSRIAAHHTRQHGLAGMVPVAMTRRSFCRAASVAALATGWPKLSCPCPTTSAKTAVQAAQISDDSYDAGAATSWLLGQQLSDGGFPGLSGGSDVKTTIDAVMLGTRISARMGKAHRFLLAHGPAYAATGPGQAARLALAAMALLEDPTAFGGRETDTVVEDPPCPEVFDGGGDDLVTPIVASIAAQTPGVIPGLVGRDLHDHAYALLALSAYPMLAGPDPEAVIEPFAVTQAANGGWAIDGTTDPDAADAQTTALVIQALVDWEGPDAAMERRGLDFLRSLQTPDGGFAFGQIEPHIADALSTAMGVQALLATREDPASDAWGNVSRALVRFQMPSGGFRLSMSDDEPEVPATLQAMLALSNRHLPVRYYCG